MIKVYGASDDLVEVEGDPGEEFGCYNKTGYLVFSNGVVLSIAYGDLGIWKINKMSDPLKVVNLEICEDPDANPYSDIAYIDGDIKWMFFTTDIELERKRKSD